MMEGRSLWIASVSVLIELRRTPLIRDFEIEDIGDLQAGERSSS
jgi:hypothetical protein